ncbi:hypothetical protein [Nonomuraea sp. NPDC049709]|uniref:hypothetical protein n=1 Tax=Nonomuraea sp. NPDC049709 TaxID=3154736 RepID=UPI00344A0CDC
MTIWSGEQARALRPWLILSLGLAGLSTIVLFATPIYASLSEEGESSEYAVGVVGVRALYFLLPVLIAAIPLAFGRILPRTTSIAAAMALFAWCFVSLASVGMFFLPSAACMLVAAILAVR